MTRRLPEVAALCFVVALVLAALVRDAACRHGLPYIMYWDEYAVTGAALKMMQERSLDPHFYGYGALLTYVTLLFELPVVAWLEHLPATDPRALESIQALQIGGMDGLGAGETSHPELYYAGRLVVALMGVLTIATTAGLARRFAVPGRQSSPRSRSRVRTSTCSRAGSRCRTCRSRSSRRSSPGRHSTGSRRAEVSVGHGCGSASRSP
jgi:hypothetical protein